MVDFGRVLNKSTFDSLSNDNNYDIEYHNLCKINTRDIAKHYYITLFPFKIIANLFGLHYDIKQYAIIMNNKETQTTN